MFVFVDDMHLYVHFVCFVNELNKAPGLVCVMLLALSSYTVPHAVKISEVFNKSKPAKK